MFEATNLFDKQYGFRLERLELYNWGTFDGEIWTMTPNKQTAVLTGANGSGKSTVVDALLTLLIDNRKRNYNLASGAGTSRERTEKSYIRGQYSRSRSDNSIEAQANTLRDTQSYSVLLAVFEDEAKARTVTLAQVLWISNVDRVEKRYYVTTCNLSIETHFPQRHSKLENLAKDLKYDGSKFSDYIAAARKELGLGGKIKALDLFNQTVAVKDISSLNIFVRDHMLDKGDPEKRVDDLRTQYRNLNDAHQAIQRASHQIKILQPLVTATKQYRHYEQMISRYNKAKTLTPVYVAEQAHVLLKEEINKTKSKQEAEASRLQGIDSELSNKREELDRIKISIANDSFGQEKREIESKIKPLEETIKALQNAADHYNQQAGQLGFKDYQDETTFSENRRLGEQKHQIITTQKPKLDQEHFELQTNKRHISSKTEEIDKEIKFLRENPSNIPSHLAQLREEISKTLSIPSEALPFVGELLKVRDEEKIWQGALERLFNSFGQNLIVADDHYPQVSAYINENNLRAKLVYQRVDPNEQNTQTTPSPRSSRGVFAYEKLQITEKTPYYKWLLTTLKKHFSYVCVDSINDFQQIQRAITQQGQIKHTATRHEKDDRRNLQDTRNYILGWDNKDKLRQLEKELADLKHTIKNLDEKIHTTKTKLDRIQQDLRALNNLLEIKNFERIDWRAPQAEYDQLKQRLKELNQQSQQLQQLEQKQNHLQQQIKETEMRRDKITGERRSLEDRIQGYYKHLQQAEKQLENLTQEIIADKEAVADIFKELDKEPLTIHTLESRINELTVSIQGSINNFKGHQTRSQSQILNAMQEFRREYPDEGASITADIEALPSYEKVYNRLHNDDLPSYEERFKEMLDRTVTRGIQMFSAFLEEQERKITRSIDELNNSLKQVDYGSGSRIQLLAENAPDPEIQEFRRELRACAPNAGDHSQEELNRAYSHIKNLIQRFDDDPNWMRRVIDVRRWRVFAAQQIDETDKQIDYYNDSSGKSGGQKAKLAYTILASAIAYQYGLQDITQNDPSFRFVVIDEAFSKLDDDNARFAMKLFKQLGLQLLVVTPMQQLYLIEEYVEAYHLVVNNNEGNCSRLFNLNQDQYHHYKRDIKANTQ